jgi:hypothetical protein
MNMKHYTILAVFAISAFAFTSCKKSYRCTCYSPALNYSTPSFEIKETKKNAKEECESQPQRGLYTGMDYICHLE